MNFNELYTDTYEPILSAQDMLSIDPHVPEEVTAEEIEVERQILVARYRCADHEITYDFSKLPEDVYNDPENCYTEYGALSLQFTLSRYISGVLSDKIVSDRIVAVPEHIVAMAKQMQTDSNYSV